MEQQNMNTNIILSLIIVNEFCERFCFYGIRSTLYMFLAQSYGFSPSNSTLILHSFVLLCYLFAFLGGIIADNILGRYKTIVYFNVIYMFGNFLLMISTIKHNSILLCIGLLMISIGTGGIKPCISAFGGDQIPEKETKSMEKYFSVFYFSINAGSLIGMLVSPILAAKACFGKTSCYFYAFRTAAFMHFLSVILFMFGSKAYSKNHTKSNTLQYFYDVHVLPFFKVLKQILRIKNPFSKKPNKDDFTNELSCLQNIKDTSKIDNETASEIQKDFLRIKEIFPVFIFVSFFWMLFDQQSSSWVAQTLQMQRKITIFGVEFEVLPSQMQALNAVSMVLMIPLFFKILYPFIENCGYNLHSIKKMYIGLSISAFAFFVSAFVEYKIFTGKSISVMAQIPQYLLITGGEVLVSITGLEFAYSQSPESLKSFVFSAWLATTALGNSYILVLTAINPLNYVHVFGERFKNQIMYGIIGMMASFLMYRSTKKFKYIERTLI